MAAHIDRVSEIAGEALRDTAHTDEERDKLRAAEEYISPFVDLAYHRQFFVEIFLARHVENYLNYLSSLLYEIFTQRPECMKSNEKVDFEFVLGHRSMETLVSGIAERKVETLSYSSFSALQEFFEDHFGLSICPTEHADVVNEAIETRNIAVHNRCIINSRYVEKTGKGRTRIGKRRVLYSADLESLVPILFLAVQSLDQVTRKHLKIVGHRFDIARILGDEYKSARRRMREAMAQPAKSA